MKNQLPLFIVAALFGLLFHSCKKDTETVFPIKFYPERVEVKSNTRMFDTAGEVNNATEISSALNGVPFFSLEKEPFNKNELALTFTSPDSMVLGSSGLKFYIKTAGNQFLLYSDEIVHVDTDASKPGNLLFYLLKYTYRGVPSLAWSTALSKETMVAYGNYKEIRLSAMAYHIVKSSGGSTSKISGLTYNEFNPEVVTKLQNDDLLIVKQYELVLLSR